MDAISTSRMGLVQELMGAHGLDAVLISNCSLGNLNGWLKDSQRMPMHLPFNRSNICIVTADGNILDYSSRTPHPCDQNPYPVFGETGDAVNFHGQTVGLVNPTYLRKTVRDQLAAEDVKFVDVSDEFHALKARKTPEEAEKAAHAASEFDRLFTTVPLLLTGEPLEREVVVALRNHLREFGAECEDLMSSSAVRMTSAPQDAPSVPEPIPYPGRRLQYGDRVNLQVTGYLPGGFSGALGRCYVLGEATEETKHYWNLAVSAQEGLAKAAKTGVTIRELTEILEHEYLAPEGLRASGATQIYGIGAALNEMPRNVDTSRDMPLPDGAVLVIAPQIIPEGKDPYCCADVFRVTDDGAVCLSKTSRQLRVLD